MTRPDTRLVGPCSIALLAAALSIHAPIILLLFVIEIEVAILDHDWFTTILLQNHLVFIVLLIQIEMVVLTEWVRSRLLHLTHLVASRSPVKVISLVRWNIGRISLLEIRILRRRLVNILLTTIELLLLLNAGLTPASPSRILLQFHPIIEIPELLTRFIIFFTRAKVVRNQSYIVHCSRGPELVTPIRLNESITCHVDALPRIVAAGLVGGWLVSWLLSLLWLILGVHGFRAALICQEILVGYLTRVETVIWGTFRTGLLMSLLRSQH